MTKELTTVETVKANRKTYFVSLLNRFQPAIDVPTPYWIHTWAHIPKTETKVRGVRLDEYLVKLDGDSGWAARVTLAGDTIVYALDDAGMVEEATRTAPRLRIVNVNVQLGAQKELVLPLRNILPACLKVGAVRGTLHSADDQNPNGYITADLSSTGHYMALDDLNALVGNLRRLPAASLEQHKTALQAAINYKNDLLTYTVEINPSTGELKTIYQYVTDATDIKDGKTLLRKARENPELQELAAQSRIRKAKK